MDYAVYEALLAKEAREAHKQMHLRSTRHGFRYDLAAGLCRVWIEQRTKQPGDGGYALEKRTQKQCLLSAVRSLISSNEDESRPYGRHCGR